MPEPRIFQIQPPSLDNVEAGFDSATITILGENFSPDASAFVIGSGTIFDTRWLADGVLECRLDVYGHEGFVIGIIVLNDPEGFAHGSSSNVVPLRIPKTIPPPKRDEEGIPF
jgi:hypothetical protein